MASTSTAFDVLMVTDCRFPGGNTSSVVEEIQAQARAGYRTGLLHVPTPVLPKPRPFATKIRHVLEEGLAELVMGVRHVHAHLLLARHPTVFTDLPADLPRVTADHVVLAVNQVPADERGERPYYDIPQVHAQIERLVGKEATWAPIGPRVRESLAEHHDSVPLLPWDWENVIDVEHWRVKRETFVSDRPVIGRHSRGHWTKWPDDPQEILAAYPDHSGYAVRVLGGAEAPTEILGRVPATWTIYPFNSMQAREFLATVDFFVYFHHPGLVEAFGRVALEALSTGAVAILPEYLQPLFGDACLYGQPHDVRGYVDRLYRDWDAYAEMSAAGVELAKRRFSYETHTERVADLIGPPSTELDRATPTPRAPATAQRATHQGTLVVDLTTGEDSAEPSQALVKAVLGYGEPCAVAVGATRAGDLPPGVAVETFPRVVAELSPGEQRRYLRTRIAGLVRAHQPHRVVTLADASDDADALLTSVEGANLEVLRVHREKSAPTGTGDDPFAETIGSALPQGWDVSRGPSDSGAELEHACQSRANGRADPQGSRSRLRESLQLRTRLRRKVRWWRRARLAQLMEKAPDLGLTLFEAEEAELSLPVHAKVTHPAPEKLPVALVVVTGERSDPAPTVRALAERQQVASNFRVALLAPPSWERAAATHGVTIETLVPESTWNSVYGGGWPEYLRCRVHETSLLLQPHTVVFAEDGVDGGQGFRTVLEVLEASRVRRPRER